MESGVNEYPAMAGLVDIAKKAIYCRASIISDRYVLTAAHCRRPVEEILLVVGEHDVSSGGWAPTNRLFFKHSHFVSTFEILTITLEIEMLFEGELKRLNKYQMLLLFCRGRHKRYRYIYNKEDNPTS